MVWSTLFRAVMHSTHWSPLGFDGAKGRQGYCGENRGPFSCWQYQRHLHLHWLVAHKVSVKHGRDPCSHSTYSIPIIIIKVKAKMGKSPVCLNVEQGILLSLSKLPAHAAPWILKFSREKTLQKAHFSSESRNLLWLSFTIPPSTGKILPCFSCQYFLLQPEGGMD